MNTTPFTTLRVSATTDRAGQAYGEQHSHLDTPAREHAAHERALVLGGGGSTGNAWVIGVLAGLLDAGLDVTTADVTIGTSSGSTAAAQLAGSTASELLAAVLATPPRQRPGMAGPAIDSTRTRPVVNHLDRIRTIIASAAGPADMRRRMGAAALAMDGADDGARQARWRATVASRLPGRAWPERTVLITAVDAQSGDPVVFDRHSGVDLADAVAASCSSGLPYEIGGAKYIDGGYRRNENADLAAGCRRVLVLSPFGGRTLHPLEWGTALASQVEELRALGTTVEMIRPGSDSDSLFGANAMDFSLRPQAARAGYDRGKAVAARITDFWR